MSKINTEKDLPESVTVSKNVLDCDLECIADYLSDNYGFCVFAFSVDETEDKSTYVISDIVWDTAE